MTDFDFPDSPSEGQVETIGDITRKYSDGKWSIIATTISGPAGSIGATGPTGPTGPSNIPISGSEKTSSYTLVASDTAKYIQVGTGGSVTIPNSVFSQGDCVTIANNTSGSITITCSITTAYIAGVNSTVSSASLVTRGVATVLFLSATSCLIGGNVT
jgi:hypothetical protein